MCRDMAGRCRTVASCTRLSKRWHQARGGEFKQPKMGQLVAKVLWTLAGHSNAENAKLATTQELRRMHYMRTWNINCRAGNGARKITSEGTIVCTLKYPAALASRDTKDNTRADGQWCKTDIDIQRISNHEPCSNSMHVYCLCMYWCLVCMYWCLVCMYVCLPARSTCNM